MRLWHQDLIPYLPRQQLLGQHRECCALRGMGLGKKHKIVDYVFTYDPMCLYAYHSLVMDEMESRGYKPDSVWRNIDYRGKALGYQYDWCHNIIINNPIYPEHNDEYLKECLDNLKNKGIMINLTK